MSAGEPALATVADGNPIYTRQTPSILRPDYTGTIELEIVYAGLYANVRVFQWRNSEARYVFDEYPRTEIRTLEGRTVSVFRPSWPAGEFIRSFGLAIDFDSGVGTALIVAPSSVPLASNGAPTIRDDMFIRAMSASLGAVPVEQVDPTLQYSSHVVNIVAPGSASRDTIDLTTALQRFYATFSDDYDQVAVVYGEETFVRGLSVGGHIQARNRIGGIGLRVDDPPVVFGSPGRLEGVTFFLHTMDGSGALHEVMHQWASYFYWPGIAGITQFDGVHDPLWGHFESPTAAFLYGNIRLRPLGGLDWETERVPEPTRLPPLLGYAMGRVAPAAVPPIDVFEDQNRLWTAWPGARMSGTTRHVTIDQVIAYHGPRTGPVVNSVRLATLLLSRDALATPAEMAFWTLQAQRLEDPNQTGMITESGIGGFRAVTGVPLTSRITPLPGRPVLAGHPVVEPDALDPRDLAGVVVDRPPSLDVPSTGVYRLHGRIVNPALAGASRIELHNGGNPTVLSSPVAADGSFNIIGSPGQAAGRYAQSLYVNLGGVDRYIAGVSNVRYFAETRVPPPPVALDARATGNSVAIAWSPDTGSAPTTYFLDVGSSPGASNIGSIPSAGAALAAAGVPTGRYYLRVRAANAAGVSAPSGEVVLDVGACAPPQPPSSLVFTLAGSTLALVWQPSPSPGASYTLLAGSSSGASDIAQALMGGATALTVPGVPPGRYFIRVHATTACGAADSNEIQVTVGGVQAPGAPGTLTAQVTGSTVNLAWSAAAGVVTDYVLEAGSQSGASNLVVAPVGTALAFSASAVPRGNYFVRVRAMNAVGHGPPSNEVVVTVP